jgi:hypothetical protein
MSPSSVHMTLQNDSKSARVNSGVFLGSFDCRVAQYCSTRFDLVCHPFVTFRILLNTKKRAPKQRSRELFEVITVKGLEPYQTNNSRPRLEFQSQAAAGD